ncbi:hypothetical protein GLOIN_2v1788062 [Rhizophagus clarus]|uniref:Uncharacterized protein n=1 Tax=Rhizophagus clarus TaxID=94130 RepID=A0A8H3QC14_9GLOM|nr:hypothetical protein GLOIN_2v1788062 [Rhizophagus clarus]
MNLSEKYSGQDALISYLKKRNNKSYLGFLNLYRDVIIASPTSDICCWNDLDNSWAGRYIREAENIFVDKEIIEALKKKILSEIRLSARSRMSLSSAADESVLQAIVELLLNEELLLKSYIYYSKKANEWKKTTIGEILNNGIKQLERYKNVTAKGQATKNSVGIRDRIKIINSSSPNMWFIVVVIGFHRIICRSVDEKLSNYKYNRI